MGQPASAPTRTYRGEAAEERQSRRRAQLLEAGLELLGTEGWQATTVTAVCERARLTPRYFYESFADRNELLIAIFDGVMEEIANEASAAAPTGLGGGVWSGNEQRAKRVAHRLRTGQVEINGAPFNPLAPFGGFKQSGHGRELGKFGIEEFLAAKAIQLK